MNKFYTFLLLLISIVFNTNAQTIKILFDASKAETAGNADWVIDEDLNNMTWNPKGSTASGSEGNAQRIPTPAQSTVTSTTTENYWKGALSAWGIDCVKKGYVVETLPYNGTITYGNTTNLQDLSNYKVYIIVEPNILFTTAEKTAIMNFVQNGGGLFIVSDHAISDRNNDGYDSQQILNDLIKNNSVKPNAFGFIFDSLSVSPNTTNIPYLPNDSILNGPMGQVTQAMWASGTTMTLNPSDNATVKGVVFTPSVSFGNIGVMAAYARFGKGKIVGLGDSSPCDDGSGDTGDNLYDGWIADANGNHEKLIMNATIWLATKDTIMNTKVVDLSMDSLLYPINITRGNNAVSFKITNNGNTLIDSAVFAYQIDKNTPISVLVKGLNIYPQNSYYYTFSNSFNISTGGTYKLKTWVKTFGDNSAQNDTLNKTFYLNKIIDLAIDSIVNPINLERGADSVKIKLFNNGETTIDSAIISLQLNTDSIISTKLNGLNIAAKSSYYYTFNKPLNISTGGNYKLNCWVKTNGDINANNDTVIKTYILPKTTSLQIDSILLPIELKKGPNTISIKLKNNGESVITRFSVSCKILEQNIAPITDEVTLINLQPNSYAVKSFSNTINIDKTGDYKLCAWISEVNGINIINDSICYNYSVSNTSINNLNQGDQVIIYPNPTTQNELNITSQTEAIRQVVFYELNGKEIQVNNIDKLGKNIRINTENLKAGIYFIKINTDQYSLTKKWIKH